MICPVCGAEGAKEAAFCSSCGRPFGHYSVGTPSPLAAATAAPPGSFRPVYAGFWLRFVAHLIDGVIIGVGALVLALLFAAFFWNNIKHVLASSEQDPNPADVAVFIAVFVVYALLLIVGQWLDYAWMESSERQATLGKMALGLIVTDMEGRRVSFGRASGRFFAKIISGMIPFAIGYIVAGFTAKKQAVHDMIASCLVLRKT